MSLDLLYEDNHCIAVVKPAGILTQGDKTGDTSLLDEVKEYLKKKYNKPGNVFVGLVHRLDRPVSGIIVFAKTSKGASRLSEQIRNHTVEKVYTAWVEGVVSHDTQSLIHWLKKDSETNVVSVYTQEKPDTQRAELSYTVQQRESDRTLLEIHLGTGRSHQIRAQLAAIGHPILGDSKYGSKTPYKNGAIALCASRLCFNQPVTGERVSLKLDNPLQ